MANLVFVAILFAQLFPLPNKSVQPCSILPMPHLYNMPNKCFNSNQYLLPIIVIQQILKESLVNLNLPQASEPRRR